MKVGEDRNEVGQAGMEVCWIRGGGRWGPAGRSSRTGSRSDRCEPLDHEARMEVVLARMEVGHVVRVGPAGRGGGRGGAWPPPLRRFAIASRPRSTIGHAEEGGMKGLDVRLMRKGKKEPREGLVQQARVHLELARRFAERLARFGWTPADTDRLATGLSLLEGEMARQADARGISLQATRDENEAIDEAKALLRRLRLALPRVLRARPVPDVDAQSFAVRTKLRRSTPEILGYLNRIQPAVERLDDELAPYFDGVCPSKLLREVQTRLAALDAEQEASWAKLPVETARVYEAKGRVLELIEDLNRAGKSAFDGERETAALFNKDLIVRARRKRRPRAAE